MHVWIPTRTIPGRRLLVPKAHSHINHTFVRPTCTVSADEAKVAFHHCASGAISAEGHVSQSGFRLALPDSAELEK